MRVSGRRSFVAGLGLAGLPTFLRPLGRSLVAHAQGVTPRRLVIFVDGMGWGDRYVPSGPDLGAAPLPPGFAPLEAYKREMLIADAFYVPDVTSSHHSGFATLAGVGGGGDTEPPAGVTIDRYIAQQVGKGSPVASLAVAAGTLGSGRSALPVSADGPGKPFPNEVSPVAVYARLFGSGAAGAAGGTGEAAARLAQARSVLDFVRDDVARLGARLGGSEKAKLDQYLSSIREVEGQMTALESARGTCAPPPAPPAAMATIAKYKNPFTMEELAAPHVALVGTALGCGLTRVAVLRLMRDRDLPDRSTADGKHTLSHEGNRDALTRIDAWHAGKVAALYQQLAKIPEAGGTVADNTLFVWLNSGGGSHHLGRNAHPLVLLDRSRRFGFRTGRFVRYTKGQRSLADFHLSVLHAFGIPDKTFGDPRHSRGPLAELRA
jgi:hypothetical protein